MLQYFYLCWVHLLFFFIKEDELSSNNIKWAALWSSIGTFILSCVIWLQFNPLIADYQFVEKYKWFDDFNFFYHIGVDGISLFMILLSTFLTPFCILASWISIKERIKEYMIAFLFFGNSIARYVFCNRYAFILYFF